MLGLHLVLIPVLIALAKAEHPLELLLNEEEQIVSRNDTILSYRLPEDIDSLFYSVEITPYFEDEVVNGETKPAWSFDGIMSLICNTTRDGINQIIIHENVREILSVTLVDLNEDPVELNETLPFERLREYNFLRINLRDGLTLKKHEPYRMDITYVGNINETPMSRGIFRGSYKGTDGKIHWYVASHLQPVHSRQFFPCLDEPGYKAEITIVINRPASFAPSFSNMKLNDEVYMDNRVKEVFHTTPRMSCYLVTIHISEEFKVIADNNDENETYRIIARPNAEGQGDYALEVGPPITRWLEDYFGIKYYTMAEELKNDQIAVPDWASGATENWGLVSYRELRLLYEEGETNAIDKMNIGTIIAHELAHKWFGNLITCQWWENVWINEGFASYFEYFAMDGVDKSLELEDMFIVQYLQGALSADAGVNTRALKHTVNSPAEVAGHFSGISYSKGASLLLMLKHFMTENTFKKALNYFLVEMSYEHAYPEDVYRGFGLAAREDGTVPASIELENFMKVWVEEPGFPVIQVDVDSVADILNLRQERFFISPTATQTEQLWPIPLTFTTAANPDWNNLTPSHVMTGRTMPIQVNIGESDWVIFNVKQKGIYRVNYNVENWQKIAAALKGNLSSIHHLNRAQIVDDVFAFMRSGRMAYDHGFQILEFLKKESSFYVWSPAISGFTWLRNRLIHLPEKLAEFDKIMFNYLETVIAEVGYDVPASEPFPVTRNRFNVLSFACNIGHKDCITDAVNKYSGFRNNRISVNPNIRRHVYCKGIHEGSYADWRFMYQRWLGSNNQADESVMLRALGCSTDEQAVKEYLETILTPDVRAQDRVNAFTFLYMGDRKNANLALQFIKERYDEIKSATILQASFNSVISNLASYLDEQGLADMEQWLQTNQANIPEYGVGINAINLARASMNWGTEMADTILNAAKGSAVIVLPATLLLATTLLALFLS
ncbi:hypothetical protein O0L34_g4648 [Tuta absoluta]|nr:hypothetical protein O0L34_g4648 [Tuta absoluta]